MWMTLVAREHILMTTDETRVEGLVEHKRVGG